MKLKRKVKNKERSGMMPVIWCELRCVNCHRIFRVLQQNADDVIECPFCKIYPWGFAVTGTNKEHKDE